MEQNGCYDVAVLQSDDEPKILNSVVAVQGGNGGSGGRLVERFGGGGGRDGLSS